MSEHITHLAICDDTARLAAHHPGVHPLFKELLAARLEIARMGTITRSADRWTAELLTWAREEREKPEPERDSKLDDKIAFVLGSLAHRSADRLMKPIIRCWVETEGKEGSREATIHQDICSFREVYGGGEGPYAGPFPKSLLDVPSTEAQRQLEAYLRVVWQRALIGMHTFAPDTGHIQDWLTKLLDPVQAFPIDLGQYARIAAEWDPAKVRKYLIDKHFYDRQDALIRYARTIQYGGTISGEEVVRAAAETHETCSRYARALAKALDYFVAATQLFEGRITTEEARDRFDVGIPELSLA